MMKKLLYFLGAAALSIPYIAFAHEKWFVSNFAPAGTKPWLFATWNRTNASFILAALFAFLAAVLIHFALRPHAWTRRVRSFWNNYKAWVSPLLRILTGLLLFTASFSRFLFAPDLSSAVLAPPIERVFLAIQLVTGLALIIGLFPRFMSLFGLTLYLALFFIYPVLSVLSYLTFVGIFAYLIIIGDPALPKVRGVHWFPNLVAIANLNRAKPYAMSILRMLAGLTFILVAVLYKLWEPGYALEFLRIHAVNFMPAIGFKDFTNEMFVMAAGITEAFLGLCIFFGILPRFIGGLLIVAFTVTLGIFGITELVGHLPLYAVAFALLVNGAVLSTKSGGR